MTIELTRKQFLQSVGMLAASGLVPRPWLSAQTQPDQGRRERIARVIREYDSQGDHRTGTPVDAESGRWLAEQIDDIGLAPELEWLGFSKIDVHAAYVEVDGHWAEGVPLFDGGFTDAEGISGRLGDLDGDAEIGLAHVGPRPGQEFSRYRQSTSQRAAVTVTGGPENGVPAGIAVMNAPSYTEPFGPAVLQVGSEHRSWLQEAASAGARARVVAHVTRRPEEVINVVATVRGTRSSLQPLIVMTPRSGWWTCASERGGGIAVWLEMMRGLQEAEPARSTVFVASTGHELGHYGLNHFISTRSSLVTTAVAWIHLGANFGAAIGGAPRLQASSETLQRVAVDAMTAAGQPPDRLHPLDEPPGGEARSIHDGAGRYISLLGGNGLFHHPHDRWPGAVDVDRIARFAEAFIAIATELTRADAI